MRIAEHATLLEFFFGAAPLQPLQASTQLRQTLDSARRESGSRSAARFVVFTMLVPYLYHSGDVGQLARDALLLVLTVSRRSAKVALRARACTRRMQCNAGGRLRHAAHRLCRSACDGPVRLVQVRSLATATHH